MGDRVRGARDFDTIFFLLDPFLRGRRRGLG